MREILGHGRDHHEHARTALPAAEPPALVGARARRPARGLRAHAAPRRRAAARARLRHRVDPRHRRRLPARGRHRPAAAPAHRRRGRRDRGRPALAGDGRPARRRAHHAQRAREDRAGAAARAASPHRRARLARDGRRRRAMRAGARRPRSTPSCSACSPWAAATPSGCGSGTRMPRASHVALDRAAPARAGRPALVPARLGPRPRGLAHVPARPHRRRVPDARALRAAGDDRRGRARARAARAAMAIAGA